MKLSILLLLLALSPNAFIAEGSQIEQPVFALRRIADASGADAAGSDSSEETEAEKEQAEEVAPPREPRDIIEFLNSDRLHGKIVSIEEGTGVKWERKDVKDPIRFSTNNLKSIRLATLERTDGARGGSDSRVRLKDGSDFPGKLLSIDDSTVTLGTWYAGDLAVKRSEVDSILIARESVGLLFEGPGDLADWEQQNNRENWKIRGGGLISSQSSWIGRRIEEMPDQVRIDFDMQWTGQLALLVSLMPKSLENYSAGSYTIQLNSGYVYMYRNTGNGNHNLGQTQINELRTRNKVRVGLRLDRKEKVIALLINGSVVKQWKESGKWIATGDGLLFYSQGQGPVKISNIEVAGWDGSIRDGGDPESDSDADLVTLTNGDKVSGDLLGVTDGTITFSTSFAPELKIPIDRVANVEFAGSGNEIPEPARGMVRAFFQEEGSLLFELSSLSRESVNLKTGSFGEATVNPAAFKSLQFNLDQNNDEEENDLLRVFD